MSAAICGAWHDPGYRSDVLRQVVWTRDIVSLRFSPERGSDDRATVEAKPEDVGDQAL